MSLIHRKLGRAFASGLLILATAGAASLDSVSIAGTVATYSSTDQQLNVPFGSRSHWAQPWRATMTTVPTAGFLNGIGINYQGQDNPDLEMRQLSEHGIKRVRLEIGWGNLDYATESRLADASQMSAILAACSKYGVRPLILLNANSGGPCPYLSYTRTVVNSVPAGATSVTLDDVDGLTANYSGLSNLSTYCAAEDMVTSISGQTITLSKPLPNAIAAGTSIQVTTLKYRPFSAPGSADNDATIAGWKHYVDVVGTFVSGCMPGTTTDAGFDMEVWNELTFDSQFLSINNYYQPALESYDQTAVWGELTAATAEVAADNPAYFTGVGISDGFANTIPWPAASTEPLGITAISKHPYHGRSSYPDPAATGTPLNAQYQPDTTGWEPTYTELFPEYSASMIQTESVMRDLSTLTTNIGPVQHGQSSRAAAFEANTSDSLSTAPVPVWITEAGIAPDSDNPSMDTDTALYLKAKTTLRYYAFYLGKGAGMVTLYNDCAGDRDLGLVSDAFLAYASEPGATYPANDASLTSPALTAVGNMAQQMNEHLSTTIGSSAAPVRKLRLTSVSDTHDHMQFAGDGTSAHPPLYDRDVLAFLPTQVNTHRFAIPFYVMTRDVYHVYTPSATGGHQYDMPDETFTLSINGIETRLLSVGGRGSNGISNNVKIYDPISNRTFSPTSVVVTGPNSVTIGVSATDYPRILLIDETHPAI